MSIHFSALDANAFVSDLRFRPPHVSAPPLKPSNAIHTKDIPGTKAVQLLRAV